jgi:hypothetical protein
MSLCLDAGKQRETTAKDGDRKTKCFFSFILFFAQSSLVVSCYVFLSLFAWVPCRSQWCCSSSVLTMNLLNGAMEHREDVMTSSLEEFQPTNDCYVFDRTTLAFCLRNLTEQNQKIDLIGICVFKSSCQFASLRTKKIIMFTITQYIYILTSLT